MIREEKEDIYEFGPFRLDTSERLLLSNGQPTAIKAKVFDLLIMFVENSGHVLQKEELMRYLWPDTQVEEHNLTVSVSELRKILAGGDHNGRYIQTVPRKGYRFFADVRRLKNKSAELFDAEKTDVSAKPSERLPPFELAVGNCDSDIEAKHPSINETKATTATPAIANSAKPTQLNWKRSMVFLLGVNAILVTGFSIWLTMSRPRDNKYGSNLFKDAAVNKITNNGKIRHATISPDGRYIAYIAENSGTQNVYIKQITTDSTLQLTPATVSDEGKLTFSPDGDFIYYTKATPNNTYDLYRVPALSGESQKVLENVDSPITFSPDGKQFAFIRRSPGVTETVIADGSHERILAVRKSPDFFSNAGPSWSPDGKLIACIVGSISTGLRFNVAGVRLADGTEQTLTAESLNGLTSIVWLPDGSGLLATASPTGSASGGDALRQILHISYPEGRPQLITNDASSYKAISVASDSHTLMAVQEEVISSLSVAAPESSSEPERQIDSGRSGGYMGMSATPDGKIVYASIIGGATDIWLSDADGSNQKRLTNTHREMFPTISPDGRMVVYVSYNNQTPHLWRMNMDSHSQQQITDGDSETLPRFSPDGKFIIFLGAVSGKRNLFKLSVEGGTPTRLTDFSAARMPAISPDGKMIACYFRDEALPAQWNIAVLPSAGGKPLLTFPLPSTIDPNNLLATMRWSPDGRALTYIADQAGSSNIWSLPLDGGKPKRITDYNSQEIFDYDWSSNDRHLVVVRGSKLSDVIIMSATNHAGGGDIKR